MLPPGRSAVPAQERHTARRIGAGPIATRLPIQLELNTAAARPIPQQRGKITAIALWLHGEKIKVAILKIVLLRLRPNAGMIIGRQYKVFG